MSITDLNKIVHEMDKSPILFQNVKDSDVIIQR